MGVKVNLHPFLHGFTDGVKTAEVNGRTVGECLTQLVARFPGIERGLFDKGNRKLLSTIGIWVNGEDAYPDELAKPVKEGDVIHITALIGGGREAEGSWNSTNSSPPAKNSRRRRRRCLKCSELSIKAIQP